MAPKYVLILCEKGKKTMKDYPFLYFPRQKKSEPLYVRLLILVNRTRDEMSLRTGRQIYGPPDVADLQPLFNLQIPAT